MTIDVDAEDLLSFAEATKRFPGRDKISLQSLHRYRLRGVRGVKLETILIGGLRYTSKQAIARFVQNQNATEQPVASVTPTQRRRQAEAANELLRSAGI